MMTKGFAYTIPAIPTVYNGRRYRSRLEARWAAFFDRMGWQHEYEPRDLGSWSPDFALWGSDPSKPILVEVKPIHAWDRTVARKMADAMVDASLPIGSACLLLGAAIEAETASGCAYVGWFGHIGCSYEAIWTDALLGRIEREREDNWKRTVLFDLSTNDGAERTMIWRTDESPEGWDFGTEWKAAANAVQWKGPHK